MVILSRPRTRQSVSDYGEPETGWSRKGGQHLFAGLYDLLRMQPGQAPREKTRHIPMKNSFWARRTFLTVWPETGKRLPLSGGCGF